MTIAAVLDLTAMNPQVEIIVRAGNVQVQDARQVLQDNYRVEDRRYQNRAGQNMRGLSVVFHPGATYQLLVQRNALPHRMLSYATIARMQTALLQAQYDMILYQTPSAKLPDHHSLVVSQNGQELLTLPDAAADALIAVLAIVPNPNPRKP